MTMNQTVASPMYTDTFGAKFENVGDVVLRAQEYLLSCRIDGQLVSMCMLALSEAFNNVVEHSYAGRDDGEAELRIYVTEDKVLFYILDWGFKPPENIFYDLEPMPDPLSLPEGGWGLALINTVMDGVAYRFDDGANHLELVKLL